MLYHSFRFIYGAFVIGVFMTKDEFVTARTKILSKMLDNPDQYGIYPTSVAFAELDDLFDQLSEDKNIRSGAQEIRDANQ
jgi:hypothetical protein